MGYRGGKLDINGNDLTFHALNAADEGAILTNSGSLATTSPILIQQTPRSR